MIILLPTATNKEYGTMNRKQTLITPCGTFTATGNIEALFNSLPSHKFGWGFLDFYSMYVDLYRVAEDGSVTVSLV